MRPSAFQCALEIDEEGVVRVVQSTSDRITMTPEELGQVLTALVKAICGPEDTDQTVNVSLN